MKKNDISYDDFCNLVANNVYRASISSTQKYLKGIYKTILQQLELNQRINIKGFGCFEIKERKSGERIINNPKINEKQLVYVKPKYSIFFKASSNFDFSVNENDFKITSDRNKDFRKSNKRVKRKSSTNIVDVINRANKRKGVNDNG